MQEDESVTRKIQFEGREIVVVKVYDKGWEGIVYQHANTGEYYIEDLMWIGGGYTDRIRAMSAEEFERFSNS